MALDFVPLQTKDGIVIGIVHSSTITFYKDFSIRPNEP